MHLYFVYASLLFTLCVVSVQAQPGSFTNQALQLKGIAPLATTEACGDAPIRDHQKTIDALGVGMILHPASSCEINIGSLAGLVPSQPTDLLFWNGALARMIIKFSRIDLEQTADLRTALIQSYGKPKTRRNPPFKTDVWIQKDSMLELQTTWVNGEPVSAGIYLSHVPNWNKFLQSTDNVRTAKNKAIALERKADVR